MYRIQLHPVPHAIPHALDLWWSKLEPGTSERARRELCRQALCETLSRRLGRTVEHSEFVNDDTGKPRLEPPEIAFNLSHSGCEILIGVGSEGEIGVDLEVVRPIPEVEALVAEYCTAAERNDWLRTTASKRDIWLLRCWTRKEACLKSIGAGLSLPPAAIEVGPGPEPARVTIGSGTAAHVVDVFSTALPSGSPAAVAVLVGDRV